METAAPPPVMAQAVFTVGFSTIPVERFLDNLRAYGVELLVDVRSKPFSRFAPQFNRERLAAALSAAGVEYRHMGGELGGMPEGPEFYDAQGYVLYDRIAALPAFQEGLRTLLGLLAEGRRLAIACAEGDPRVCHRRLLVGRVLREQGVGVTHILPDGGLIAEAELLDEERAGREQHSLFGADGERSWRSVKPVKKKG